MEDGDGHHTTQKQYVRWNKYSAHEGKSEYFKCPEVTAINMDLICPFLLDLDPKAVRKGVPPSKILHAMSLTTEERLEALRSPLRKYKLGKPSDVFGICPEVIIFQKYEIMKEYCALVSVTNRTSVAQNLKIYFEASRFFSLSIEKMPFNFSRIAPGMTVNLKVTFLPTDFYRDYIHQIKLSTNTICFQIPIWGLGPRPFIYMPDKIILPPTLVKVESTKTIVMKNTGEGPLDYSKVISEPFSCNIEKATVPSNGILELQYSIYPRECGLITGHERTFLGGEFCIFIELECEVKTIRPELSSHIITFEDVYIGLCIRQVLTLHNSSSHTLNFAWKSGQEMEENEKITKLINLMEEMKDYELHRCEKLKYFDIIDDEGHKNIYDRIFHDEVEEIDKTHTFLFKSDFFEIIPKVGKILPNTTFEFSMIFGPKQNMFYYSSAYLDLEGVERKIRISLQGYGIGPPVILSVKTLEAGQIYLTDKHQYELVVMNKGVIPATVTFQPKKTDWGGEIKCIPQSLVLGPNSSKGFIVIFSSDIQGNFIETLDFLVNESGDHLQCIFSGNVICPLLKCIPESLNFSTIAVGICTSKVLCLVNESRVSIRYDIEFEDNFATIGEENIDILPRSGTVLPLSGIKIKIAICCKLSSEWNTNLLVIMWNSRLYQKKIPLAFKCCAPKITATPEIITIKFCFLDCTYDRSVTLSNKNDLAGYVDFVPQEESEDNPIVCIPERTQLFFEPHASIELPLKIIVKELGPHTLPLKFLFAGSGVEVLCTINCNGQGPVISYLPDQVYFGQIQVFDEVERTLTLVNDSPILAKFRVYCKDNTMFKIQDADGELQLNPEEQMDVTITACFNAPGSYKDTILLNIFQGDISNIKVAGEGEGTSVYCEPALVPELNFGVLLTFKPVIKEIKIQNRGNALHRLFFTQKENVRSMKEAQGDSQNNSPLSLTPNYVELLPSEKSKIEIKCFSKKPVILNENYFCYAQIGTKAVQVVQIMQFYLKAQFVDPSVSFSTNELTFRVDVKNNVAEGNIEEILTINNATGIPMNVRISTADDTDNLFAIVGEKQEKDKQQPTFLSKTSSHEVDDKTSISVRFNPSVGSKRKYVKQAKLVFEYESHPKTDIISLQGAVMFPTLKWVPSEVQFKCVPLGSTAQKHLVLQNISAMPARFQCFWLEESVEIVQLPPAQDTGPAPKTLKMVQHTASIELMEYIEQKKFDLKSDETEHSDAQSKPSLERSMSRDFESEGTELAKMICYDVPKYKNDMRRMLSNVLAPYRQAGSQMSPSRLRRKGDNRITKLFFLEPSEGILEPYEYTTVTIGFNPPPNTQVTATAICKVEGGDEESLMVMGKSSKLSYKLDKSSVNYGNQIFCEVCTGQLTLTNSGLCSIKYVIVMEEMGMMQEEMLDVSPRSGKISPGESINFKVDYFPGFPGYFNKSFTIELGYLEPATINVTGYAVLSQVYLCVPRLEMDLTAEQMYTAVAWITPEYLQYVMQESREILDKPDDPRNFLEENDWVYVSYNDCYPSQMDIIMAMERLAAWLVVRRNPKLLRQHTVQKLVPFIPGFLPAPYLVDFGHVIRDLPVCYTIMIYNYGPVKSDVKLLEDNKTALLEKEIKLEFRTGSLEPGQSTPLYVIFAPTKRKYKNHSCAVEESFRLYVKHGPTITVNVTGKVTLPVLSLEHEELVFEQVYCGDVLRKSVVLSNNGSVPSKWRATILKLNKKADQNFFVFPNQGELSPCKQTHLNIYFVPSSTQEVLKTLKIEIEFSTKEVFLNLIGRGLDSGLAVMPDLLEFPPVLSYNSHMMGFGVQNLTGTPLEFYFSGMNNDTEHEKSIIQAYLKYKNVKQVFCPLLKPGTGLPDIFKQTHNFLIEKLKSSLMSEQKKQAEHSASLGSSLLLKEGSRLSDVSDRRKSVVSFQDPLARFSIREIHNLVMDYLMADEFDRSELDSRMGKTRTVHYKPEDSNEKIEIIEPPAKPESDEINERKGALFVFHGAPLTDFYKAATQVSIALKIPRYSIDQLIMESIIEDPTSPIAKKIVDSVEDAFKNSVNPKTDEALIKSLAEENIEYDKIWDKIRFIKAPKSKKGILKSGVKEKESKASSEKSNVGKGKQAQGDCFLNLTSDSLIELLKPKFKSTPQMVIESLHSTFIPHENLAFYTVLKAAGFVSSIHFVLLSQTVSDFVKNEVANLQLDGGSVDKKIKVDNKAETVKSKGSKPVSEKTSRSGSPPKKDFGKKALQALSKPLKADLDAFETLRAELIHVAQYWDKKTLNLRKPYSGSGSSKSSPSSGKNAKNSVKKINSSTQLLLDASVDVGINLWLLLNSGNTRSINYPEMIRNCIGQDKDTQAAIRAVIEDQKVKIKEFETHFSIISKPSRRKNEISDTFFIRDYADASGSLNGFFTARSRSKSGSSLLVKSKKKRSSKGSRKSMDAHKAVHESVSTMSNSYTSTEFTPKSVLMPGELSKYVVKFHPKKRGLFTYTFYLESSKNKQSYEVKCQAVCELPQLDTDPEVMFPKVVDTYQEKAAYDHYVYIRDVRTFDFGTIIAGNSPDKCLLYSSSLVLRNATLSTCEVEVTVDNDVFCIEPTHFAIESDHEDYLKVSVRSAKVGNFTAKMYISTRNNPEVEEFNLACSACKLEFSVFPKVVNFDKVPVSFSARRSIRLTNTTSVNLHWEFVDASWITEIFNLSLDSGHVPLYSTNDIVFRFHPTEEMSFPKRNILMKVYDVNSTTHEPCYVDTIAIHADSVEYNLQLDDQIDFGEIKGGVEYKHHFSVSNKGKCDVALKVEMIVNPLEEHNFVREYFRINPAMLLLPAQKTEHLTVFFHPKSNFSTSKLLLFVVNMLESFQSGHIVKSYKVFISAASFMPSYKLCPLSSVNFGHVPLSQSKQLKLEITNRGKFPFNFSILNYAKFLESTIKKGGKKSAEGSGKKTPKSADTSSKKSETSEKKKRKKGKEDKTQSETSKNTAKTDKKDKKKPVKVTKLDIGRFSLVPSSGVVEPGQSLLTDIEFNPNEAKEYKEEILMNILEIENVNQKKVLTLKGIGCEAKINLFDFDSIFTDQYLVGKIDEFVLPKNVDGACVFSSADFCLYFKLVCINASFMTRLYFKNVGFVTSQITTKTEDGNRNVFSCSPGTTLLEPHSTNYVEVCFSPKTLEQVNGTLEISYNASKDNKLTVQLHGQACVPQIRLLQPITENCQSSLNFGPVCAGYSKQEQVSFKNIGSIKCKVIAEVSRPDIVALVPSFDTKKMLNLQDLSESVNHVMVNLLMEETAHFSITFNPKAQEDCKALLTLHTIRNPYEIFKIELYGASYDNDIIIENLEATQVEATGQSGSSFFTKDPIGYLLNMGFRQLNRLSKSSFIIRNRSECDVYKFRFYCQTVSFIPEVGHLKPKAFKEVLVVFRATKPVIVDKEEITCMINKIQYTNPERQEPLSWDDRQKFVYSIETFEESSDSIDETVKFSNTSDNTIVKSMDYGPMMIPKTKMIIEGSEPEHTTSINSQTVIPIYLSVMADYCKYLCETSAVDLPETYVNEVSFQSFYVENSGSVPLTITWTLIDKDAPPTLKRTNSATLTPSAYYPDFLSFKSSSSSSFTSYTHSDIIKQPNLPLTIDPDTTTIKPGELRTFDVHFSPESAGIFDAILQSSIPELDPRCPDLEIDVRAHALPVQFYFELDNGVSTNQDARLSFENVGVASESVRKLLLVNTSDHPVTFTITARDKKEFSYFICDTPKGCIDKNKKCIASFTFGPPIFGTFKEDYLLHIPETNVNKTIYLSGVCREPKVYFTETNVPLKATVPKVKTCRVTNLRNEEDYCIAFKFIKKSLYSESQREKLDVFPVVGKMRPHSDNEIKFVFTSNNVVTTNFHVRCLIEKLKSPLGLHVSACCLKIEPLVSLIDKSGEKVRLFEDKVNVVDLGYTYKGRTDSIQFDISNHGQTGMFYTWQFDLKPVAHLFNVTVEPEKEFLKSGQKIVTYLNVVPLRTGQLKQFRIALNVMYGPTYTIHLNAIADKPCYSFSFNHYDFGYCLTQSGETNYYSTTLTFKNLDGKCTLLENLFEKTDFLNADFGSSSVHPGESRVIPVHFYPRKEGRYKTNLIFTVGGIKELIPVKGHGVNAKVELGNPKDKFINFGEVFAHTTKKYRVGVVNASPAKIEIHFDVYDNLVVHTRKVEKIPKPSIRIPVVAPPPTSKETKKDKDDRGQKPTKEDKKKADKSKEDKSKSDKKSDKASQQLKALKDKQEEERLAIELALKQKQEQRQEFLKSFTIVPNMFIEIPARGKGYFDIAFSPTRKMNFEEKIYFEVQDTVEPFCVIKGSSVVPEFVLDKNECLFLGVITGCTTSQILTLKNVGDIMGSFTWKMEDRRNMFTIEPKQGFVMPNNDIKIKITFSPKGEKCEYRIKAQCCIKEFKDMKLNVILRGNAIRMPEPTATIKFKCNVREKAVDHDSIVVCNNSSEHRLLTLEISNDDAFSTPKEIIAMPFTGATVPVTYAPKWMTAPEKPHESRLFIKMPDGSGLIYTLTGTANPPAIKAKYEKEIRCKHHFYQTIPVQNWLTVKQTFHVVTEMISPRTTKSLYKVSGFKTIELNALELKHYKWGVYVINEGPIDFRVTFKNLDSKEYEYFEVYLTVLPGKPVAAIAFDTRVRESLTKRITLENPVDVRLVYTLECSAKNLVVPRVVNMEPYTTAKIDITYEPLYSETLTTILEAKCDELGTFTFTINLKAIPPRPEDTLTVTSELGARTSKTIFYNNTFDRLVEFTYKFEDEVQFSMERCPAVPAGETAKILFNFDPYDLGLTKTSLYLSSAVAGEYFYPIEAECIPPTPKGPYTVRSTQHTIIEFKNPFIKDTEFQYYAEPSEIFESSCTETNIKPRKTEKFHVFVTPGANVDLNSLITGRFIVHPVGAPEMQWKYYLKLVP